MKTSAVTFADLAASVLAVPPLARDASLRLDRAANTTLIRHMEAGGVSTLLYGGNANFYNIGLGEYASVLDFLAETAGANTWVIPSAGPDFGKMLDQAAVLKTRSFPTAMVLPQTFPHTMSGVETGLRRFAEAYGKPFVLYIKAEGYITPESAKKLVDEGLVCAIKYAIVRQDPQKDAYLTKLIDLVDRRFIVSGMGERPAVVHMRDFALQGFTTGSGCVGPKGSQRLLEACKRKDWATAERLREAYLPLEDLRDGLSPIRVLHEAVSLSGLANMGPILPLLSNIEPEHHAAIKQAATALLSHDRAL